MSSYAPAGYGHGHGHAYTPASPPPSTPSPAGMGYPPALPVDPYHNAYPRAPHMRPIELPTMSPSPAHARDAHAHARTVSLPPDAGALGIYRASSGSSAYPPLPSPPASPPSHSGSGAPPPSVHPLLRFTPTAPPSLVYSVLLHPTTAALAHSHLYASSDLNAPATHPPTHALRVSVLSYPSGTSGPGASAHEFPWQVTLTAPRRASAPPAPYSNAGTLTLIDVLTSIHTSLHTPVPSSELAHFSAHQVQCARASAQARLRGRAWGDGAAALIRADFLYGCTQFAGLVPRADRSFVVVMLPPAAARQN